MLISFGACGDSDGSSTDAGPSTSRPSPTTSPSASLVFRTEAATTAPPGSTTVGLTRYQFDPPKLDVKAGTVVIFLKNNDVPASDDPLDAFDRKHSLSVVGATGLTVAASERIDPQSAGVFTIEALAPGHYSIRCTVGVHALNGMVGTLDAA